MNKISPNSLLLIDAIGPFFKNYTKKRTNWSKIPFRNLEKKGAIDTDKCEQIAEEFNLFCHRAKIMGFTAITLDDVAHLLPSETYPKDLQERIAFYRTFFTERIAEAKALGLDVFFTTDSFYATSEQEFPSNQEKIKQMAMRIECFLNDFPQVKGVIFRLGECDGLDVDDDFKSSLFLKTAKETKKYLSKLLPIFEQKKKLLILRTWAVGAYPIGDLNWNEKTFKEVFENLKSDHLIVSMKFGESDFFRYLNLTRHFFNTKVAKIIEVQTRREYEGCGEYPAFVGGDYESYFNELSLSENLVGMMVWCQTGGWVKFKRRCFIEHSAIWTEINTYVTLKMYSEKKSAAQAIKLYHSEFDMLGDWGDLLELMTLSEQVVKELLYIDDFAKADVFFRRLKVPTVLTVYWDYLIVSSVLKNLIQIFVKNPRLKIRQGQVALSKIKRMIPLAQSLGLPVQDIRFMYDTFALIACIREYYFLKDKKSVIKRIKYLKKDYKIKWSERSRYSVKFDIAEFTLGKRKMFLLMHFLFRKNQKYRLIDHLLTIRFLALVYPLAKLFSKKMAPEFAQNKAMGIESVLK